MIIGAQGFTIRDYAQNEADFRETAKKLHDIGYKTLQVSAFGDIDPHIIREICDESGLSIIITHTNPQLILENTEKVIENHRIFGTNHVGIGMMPQKYTGSLECQRHIRMFWFNAYTVQLRNGLHRFSDYAIKRNC